jgi:hypothetical protein
MGTFCRVQHTKIWLDKVYFDATELLFVPLLFSLLISADDAVSNAPTILRSHQLATVDDASSYDHILVMRDAAVCL